jgi:hypothetical protein
VKSCHSANKCTNEACHPKKFKKPLSSYLLPGGQECSRNL